MSNLVNRKVKSKITPVSREVSEYKYEVIKSLNPLTVCLSIIAYTLVVVAAVTVVYDQEEEKVVTQQLDPVELKNEIIEELRKNKRDIAAINNVSSIKSEMELMRQQMIQEINSMNLKYLSLIENKEKNYKEIIKDVADRSPASISPKNGKAIPYNKVNSSIVLFKHQKLYERLKSKLKSEEQELIKTLDLTDSTDLARLQQKQDETEVTLHALKQKLYYDRQDFRKNRYIVMEE